MLISFLKILFRYVLARFLELSAALEPGTKPKCDKTAILTDAIRMVNMLQEETSRLKEQNVKLKEKINELKVLPLLLLLLIVLPYQIFIMYLSWALPFFDSYVRIKP